MMTELKNVTLGVDTSMRRVMKVIDSSERQLALVNDDQGVPVSATENWPTYSVRPRLERFHDLPATESQV